MVSPVCPGGLGRARPPARGTERLDIGDRHLNTTRYDFRVKQWKWSGSIWIDARGRMLRYKSADLSLQLTAVPE